VQSDRAGARTRSSYLRAQYHRPSARRGKNKATIAVAASMLVATWFMLRDGTPWNDLGIDFFDRRDPAKSARRLTRRLEALGYQVAITPASPPGKPPTQRQGPFPSSYPTPRRFPSLPVPSRGKRKLETRGISTVTRDQPPSVRVPAVLGLDDVPHGCGDQLVARAPLNLHDVVAAHDAPRDSGIAPGARRRGR
jgi:hypothetical protein